MKRFIFGIIIGALIVLGLIWHYSDTHAHVKLVQEDLQHAASDAKNYVVEQTGLTNLTREQIIAELEKTGEVVRRKAGEAGQSIAEATADPRKIAVIKARLLADQQLASLDISVACDNGNVTLTGTATSAENIKKAIKIAMDVDGVKKVTSKLPVK